MPSPSRPEPALSRLPMPGGRTRSLWYCGLLAFLTLVMGAQNPPPATPPAAQPPAGWIESMEGPLRLAAEARESYRNVRDYTCLFVKRELLRGQLQPENLVQMSARTQPFSVYMRWIRPASLASQEACYVAGRNNGMMRAHSTGLLGAVGFVNVDPHDPRAMQNNRHVITEAGVGHLIEQLNEHWPAEARLNRTLVHVADYEYDRRRCTRVETLHRDNPGNQLSFYRTVVYFDKETHLPIRIENYDWPRTANDRTGQLLESYSYANMRLNVGLSEATFNH